MQTKKRVILGSIIAACVVLAGGSLAFAHGMGGGWHHGGMDPAEMVEHLQVHVSHVLDEVDATADQKARVKVIVEAATKDLEALHDQQGNVHKELHEIFTSPTIDRERLETVRAAHMQALEAASKRCATALADAAEVLTPDQRKLLGEKMAKRHAGF